MEVELACALCRHLLTDPLLLPCCCRAICSACAKSPLQDNSDNDSSSDKTSVYSETDSGVVIGSNGVVILSSRPQITSCSSSQSSSIDGGGGISSILNNQIYNSKSLIPLNNTVKCPSCRKTLLLGPDGLSGLVPYPAMSRIVQRFRKGLYSVPPSSRKCQLCDGSPKEATTNCLQCKVFYCKDCLKSCHPKRGPLSTHTLVPLSLPPTPAPIEPSLPSGSNIVMSSAAMCTLHNKPASVYCTLCRCAACALCKEGVHHQHDLQPMETLAKNYKVREILFGQIFEMITGSLCNNFAQCLRMFESF